ncbi:TadE-like protein [Planctomycetes bacterium Pan216]|uniref:TadE-like protein n=1 Tax=Kolteria novifilia TaxID=2527975 RepID=A0A518AYH7_9BACT|nr:TadE-like protein [Planctomycetes bacterium Pan216]
MIRRLRADKRERRGAAAVEFAVVAPLMFMLVFGLLEFGRYVMLAQIVVTSSREGARRAALATGQQTAGSVETFVRGYLGDAIGRPDVASDTNLTVVEIAVNGTALNSGDVIEENASPNDNMRVNIQLDYNSVTWLPVRLLDYLSGAQIIGATTMSRE